MPPVGFELTISAGERPYALDRVATGTGKSGDYKFKIKSMNHLKIFYGPEGRHAASPTPRTHQY